jgi:hypothetical protein
LVCSALADSVAGMEFGCGAHGGVVEDQSTSTLENILNSVPLMAANPVIKIASNALHALRARAILSKQSPELATRLVRARDYIPF